MKIFLTLMIAMIVVLLSQTANAQDVALDAIKVTTNPDGSQDYSVTMQILLIMTVLSFLPSIIIMMTSFTRIVVVLAILRQALGLQTTPSNQIIIGIALFLSFFIMSPVLSEVQDTALTPYMNDAKIIVITSFFEGWGLVISEAMSRGCVPIGFDSYASIHDLITKDTGILIKAFDIDAFSSSLLKLMSNEEHIKQLSEECIKYSISNFRIEKIVEQWNKILK